MTVPEPLSLLTPADVLYLVRRKLASAKSDAKREAWESLESLVRAKHSSQGQQENLDRTWRISRIAVTGFRGASPDPGVPLVIDLPPCPGLTVFHGENGSGKSTIAHALTAALHPDYQSEPRNRRIKMADDPWVSCDVHVDAESAKVEVTLLANSGERIDATTTIDAENGAATRSITSDGADLEPEWAEAYSIHRPVFAYAEERREIKGADGLSSFLLGHLLIGGYLDGIRAAIKPKLEAANQAHADIADAWGEFVRELDAISGRHPGASVDAGSVARPSEDETRAAWLAANSLDGERATQAPPLLHQTDVERVRKAVGAARSAAAAYRDAASAAWGPLDYALHTFAAEAAGCSSVPDDECPVCRSTADWRSSLASRLRELEHLNEPRHDATTTLADLRPHIGVLDSMVALLEFDDAERPVPEFAAELQAALARRASLHSGHAHDSQVLSALEELDGSFTDSRFAQLALRLVEQSHALQQWNHERAAAARDFADVWWAKRDTARDRDLWKAVNDCITELEKDTRKQREAQLLAAVERTCTQLIGGTDLVLDTLGIAQKTAAPTFANADDGGVPRPLGALSAGQQNAFLLAPVVGRRSSRPFGFAVFDDPVHALDEFRIETLASFLCERAKEHQVIVFTHDERLAQTLHISTPESRFFTIERDSVSSQISITPDAPLWQRLLDACSAGLNAVEDESPVKPGVARALMRQALDAAIRDALIGHVLQTDGLNLQSELRALNGRARTRQRLQYLTHAQPDSPLSANAQAVLQYLAEDLPDWDRASHHEDPIDKALIKDERRRA